MTVDYWFVIAGLSATIAGLLVILATPRHRDQLTEWAVAAGSWLRRPPVLQPHTGRHTAAAFTVTLDAILQGRQPRAIEAPSSLPGFGPGEPVKAGNLPGPVIEGPSQDRRAGEPTPAERALARQAHGYITALDPDHISLDDTIRLTRIQQYQDEAWWQAGDNERARNWTPRARHALALPAGRAT